MHACFGLVPETYDGNIIIQQVVIKISASSRKTCIIIFSTPSGINFPLIYKSLWPFYKVTLSKKPTDSRKNSRPIFSLILPTTIMTAPCIIAISF